MERLNKIYCRCMQILMYIYLKIISSERMSFVINTHLFAHLLRCELTVFLAEKNFKANILNSNCMFINFVLNWLFQINFESEITIHWLF